MLTIGAATATLISIAVTPANPSVAAGLTQQFIATGTYSDASTAVLTGSVTWASATSSVATIGATTGLAHGVAVGTSSISATLGLVSGSTVLTVTAATLVSIAVTPANPSIAAGANQQFSATGTYSDASTADLTATVTWASATRSTATIGAAGLANGVAVGTSSISATLGLVSGSTDPDRHRGDPDQHRGDPGRSVGRGRADPAVQRHRHLLRRLDRRPHRLGHLGLGHAGIATIAPRPAWPTAWPPAPPASARPSGSSAARRLTVTTATLVSIAVTPADPSIAAGATQQFIATGTYSDATTAVITGSVTWASATPATATIGATTGLAHGVSRRHEQHQRDPRARQRLDRPDGHPATLVSIAVTPANPSIAAGANQQFVATGTYSDATTAVITGSVTWASATPATATIGATTGLAHGVAAGTSSISATLGLVSGSTVLTVTAATLVSIAVTPANPSIAAGANQQFVATGTYSDATTAVITGSVTWASATPATATISTSGLAHGVAAGTSSISATLGLVSGSTVLTVTAANHAPTARNQSVTTSEDTGKPVVLQATDVDGDSLTYQIVTGPAHGGLSGTGANRMYTPVANYNGADSFTFKVNDGQLDSNVATVSISVSAVADLPVFTIPANTAASLDEGNSNNFAFSFTDVDGQPGSDYVVDVLWGDGSSSHLPNAVTSSGLISSMYAIGVSHLYKLFGSYLVKVTLTDARTGAVARTTTVKIADAYIQAATMGVGTGARTDISRQRTFGLLSRRDMARKKKLPGNAQVVS